MESMDATAVERAIASRRAVRRFRPTPLAREAVEQLLAVASHAPSALNTQPWRVHVLSGAARERLSSAVLAAYDAGEARAPARTEWFGSYLERRRSFGERFYALLDIGRDDAARLRAQQRRNFVFYDAPVGLIFTIDRRLERPSWLDYGMFLQNIMIAARARGLDTCPQGCWSEFAHVVGRTLELPQHEMVVCGMALGEADPNAVEARLTIGREPVHAFSRFDGFV